MTSPNSSSGKPASFYANRGTVTFPLVVYLRSHDAKSLGIGVYDASVPPPQLAVAIEPADAREMVTASLEQLEIPGKNRYLLLYLLHNFGSKPCRIVVRRLNEPS